MTVNISNKTVAEAQAGSQKASESIVKDMQPAIHALVNKYVGSYHREDGTSVANVALWEAVLSFDPESNASFMTHAHSNIRLALMSFTSTNVPGPSVPERSVKRYQSNLAAADGDPEQALRNLRDADADVLSVGSADAFIAAHAALSDPKHIDRLTVEADDGEVAAVEIADPTVDVEDTALNRVMVEHMLASVSEREAQILCWTHGVGGFEVLKDQEIADLLGISRTRVVNIRKSALANLAAANTEIGDLA